MKICIAQTTSIKGEVEANIQNHLQFVKQAIALNAELIIFPELSITGYEPELAEELAARIDDPMFNRFQEISNEHSITIGIGMPARAIEVITISMCIFQPKQERISYAKQLLHADELPYFVCGNEQTYLTIRRTKIALGICYEAFQRAHFLNAVENDADLYIASVAKSTSGMEMAHSYFPKIAYEFKTPILISNSVGFCDDFMCSGESAVWDKNGELVEKLSSEGQGILLYCTESCKVERHLILKNKNNAEQNI